MDDHYSQADLEEILFGAVSEEEVTKAVQHLVRCSRCWTAAAEVAGRRRDEGVKTFLKAPCSALVCLVEVEATGILDSLKARAWWAELKDLTLSEQIRRCKSTQAYQSRRLVEVALADAWSVCPSDPIRGEHAGHSAYHLAALLPGRRFSGRLTKDLQGSALTVVANCRRLRANWKGTLEAIEEARRHLAAGSGNFALEAKLLWVHSLLCSDTGNIDAALAHSARAMKIYRELGETTQMATTAILEGNALLASGRAEDAIGAAKYALSHLEPQHTRLELLARGILIESLIVLGRTHEALHLFNKHRPVFDHAPDSSARLRVRYLEARLLEGVGCAREAETLYDDLIATYMDTELYREAFITLLTLFELHYRNRSLRKAASVCQKAIENCDQIDGAFNVQIRAAWEKLSDVVKVGEFGEGDLASIKSLILRQWNAPPGEGIPQHLPQSGRLSGSSAVSEEAALRESIPAQPPIPAALDHDLYQAARETYDRALVAAALQQAGGNISEASRRLGITRNTLKNKLRAYGL
jgi:tetratricopeptide (TPR) repeat protein